MLKKKSTNILIVKLHYYHCSVFSCYYFQTDGNKFLYQFLYISIFAVVEVLLQFFQSKIDVYLLWDRYFVLERPQETSSLIPETEFKVESDITVPRLTDLSVKHFYLEIVYIFVTINIANSKYFILLFSLILAILIIIQL